jgi:hypothetical protein
MAALMVFVQPDEIETRAAEAGVSLASLFRAADWNPPRFYRWRMGALSPTLNDYTRLIGALEAAEKRARGTARGTAVSGAG